MPRHLLSDQSQHLLGSPAFVRYNQNKVVGARAGFAFDAAYLLNGEELVKRAGEPCKAFRPSALGDSRKVVQLVPSHVLASRNCESAHDTPVGKRSLEDLSLCVREDTTEIGDLELVTQVRLVGAVSKQRLLHVKPRKRRNQIDIKDLFPDPLPQAFDEGEDVFFVAEGHFQVQLGELQRAIGAQILVAQASRDL